MNNFHVIDVIQEPDPFVIKLIENEIQFFNESKNFTVSTRIDQYINLDISSFVAFIVLLDDNRFVGFSGAHGADHYPDNTVRVGSRLWLSPKYRRSETIHYHRESTWNPGAKYLLPAQQEAVKKLGYKYSFFSREYPKRRGVFFKIVENCNKFSTFHHMALNNIYNLCRPMGELEELNTNIPCWQNVALTNFHDNALEFNMPNITLDEYQEKYKKWKHKNK